MSGRADFPFSSQTNVLSRASFDNVFGSDSLSSSVNISDNIKHMFECDSSGVRIRPEFVQLTDGLASEICV